MPDILAAKVNAAGPAPEAESVLLLDASPTAVDLTGQRTSAQSRPVNSPPERP
jgi:hypothetical protein